jgi:hypothetical protein
MDAFPQRLPLLIGLGPVRSGTSWVHELLFGHSQVATTIVKEVNFFGAHYDRGLAWYRRQFAPIGPRTKLLADISPYYMRDPDVVRRVQATIADPLFLVNLRSPYQRVLSWYRRFRQDQHPIGAIGTVEAVREEALRVGTMAPTVQCCLDIFGHERLLLLRFEDLQRDPVAVARRLQGELGLDVELPPSTSRRINASVHYRSSLLRRVVGRACPVVRLLSPRLFYLVKFSPLHDAVFNESRPIEPPGADEAIAALATLSATFEQEIDRLERMLRLDLSAWRYETELRSARRDIAAEPDTTWNARLQPHAGPRAPTTASPTWIEPGLEAD